MRQTFQGTRGHRTAYRVTGGGPTRVLLLHALTGSPEAADLPGQKGWWGPVFRAGAPLAPDRAMVWSPNLPGSCYGSEGEAPAEGWSTRRQAEVLADWIRGEDLRFHTLLGGSLGGMVALELALLAPERFERIAVIGCGARSDAWLWGASEAQRAILASPSLSDAEAIALARRVAMLTFRAPQGLADRFKDPEALREWLAFHGKALAGRFTRTAYRHLLDAMDQHDIGRDRGGIVPALEGLGGPLSVLGLATDQLFTRASVEELMEAAKAAGRLGCARWVASPHGHDAFLIEWEQVHAWLEEVLP